MIDLVLWTAAAIGACAIARLAIEIYNEARRAWFFRRTRKHVEREWKQWAEAQERRKG